MRTFSNQCHDFLRSVKVTNDVAERDIVMTEAFMHTVKDDEAQVVVAARGEGAPWKVSSSIIAHSLLCNTHI